MNIQQLVKLYCQCYCIRTRWFRRSLLLSLVFVSSSNVKLAISDLELRTLCRWVDLGIGGDLCGIGGVLRGIGGVWIGLLIVWKIWFKNLFIYSEKKFQWIILYKKKWNTIFIPSGKKIMHITGYIKLSNTEWIMITGRVDEGQIKRIWIMSWSFFWRMKNRLKM